MSASVRGRADVRAEDEHVVVDELDGHGPSATRWRVVSMAAGRTEMAHAHHPVRRQPRQLRVIAVVSASVPSEPTSGRRDGRSPSRESRL
jgi:hypothetical protein